MDPSLSTVGSFNKSTCRYKQATTNHLQIVSLASCSALAPLTGLDGCLHMVCRWDSSVRTKSEWMRAAHTPGRSSGLKPRELQSEHVLVLSESQTECGTAADSRCQSKSCVAHNCTERHPDTFFLHCAFQQPLGARTQKCSELVSNTRRLMFISVAAGL